ncbi:FAD-dependent oxidoreductase [Archaeoglobus neptunius]|uniref:FAD-dependent oxidoreductase n=1 Tax=Archaeoglobus neptunius TaxID=2798580 RepID=UPI0019296E48|nr:FAD/NAD(P)-binding oxidoreductase [Archaeoglobus neptunius]
MVAVDYVVVGAGYAGLKCAELLMDRGFKTLIFDMREAGGEISVFSRLSDFSSKYEKYIEEIRELRRDIPVDVGTVIKSKPVIVNSGNGLKRFEAKRVLLCTGATDIAPAKLNVLGKRVAGIYTLETALRLVSRDNKIGNKILIAAKEDKIVELAESQFYRMGYEVELSSLGDSINVIGRERVEGVEIEGETFKCDTLVVYGGRSPFNPLKLRGTPVGNVVTCTYDYSKVEENVKNFIAKF